MQGSKSARSAIKIFIKVVLYLISKIDPNIFFKGFSDKIFSVSKAFLAVKFDIQSNGDVKNGAISYLIFTNLALNKN